MYSYYMDEMKHVIKVKEQTAVLNGELDVTHLSCRNLLRVCGATDQENNSETLRYNLYYHVISFHFFFYSRHLSLDEKSKTCSINYQAAPMLITATKDLVRAEESFYYCLVSHKTNFVVI